MYCYAIRSLLKRCFSVESSTWSRTGWGETGSFSPITLLYVGQKIYRFRLITAQSAPAIFHPHNWTLCSRMCQFEFVWSGRCVGLRYGRVYCTVCMWFVGLFLTVILQNPQYVQLNVFWRALNPVCIRSSGLNNTHDS